MAEVVATVQNQGAPKTKRPIDRVTKGERATQLLKRKADSHVAHGWAVEWTGNTSFHAWKEYPENVDNPDEPARKDRWFSVE